MSKPAEKEESYFTDICIEKCGGKCCAPWWGIVSYPLRLEGPFTGRKKTITLRDLADGIRAREERIKENYTTKETPPRPLFDTPDRYNVAIESIKSNGRIIEMTVRAMFAFRCQYLSNENSCEIHPGVIGGEDLRPPHCGYMGSLGASYGEKGFCRIIHAAKNADTDNREVQEAIELETRSSSVFFDRGVKSLEEAAETLLQDVIKYCTENAPKVLATTEAVRKIGRNEPCYCGSGKKYKKCHAL